MHKDSYTVLPLMREGLYLLYNYYLWSDFGLKKTHKVSSKLSIFHVSKSRFLVGQSLGETETKKWTGLGEISRPIGKSNHSSGSIHMRECVYYHTSYQS